MKSIKLIFIFSTLALLLGCAANLKFIDRDNGVVHIGKTGSTIGNSGELTAEIEGEKYAGEWIYSSHGGGYTLGTATASTFGSAGYANAFGTSTSITASASGSGLITLQGNNKSYIRCVFNFNSFSDTGIGECRRNDGKIFDVTIKR